MGTQMSKVFAVVSTFNPDQSVIENVLQTARQVEKVIIVDDGSSDSSALENIPNRHVNVIKLAQNSGIAYALNTGIESAQAAGADYIVTLDQDSLLGNGYIEACLKIFESVSETTRLGLLIPEFINEHQARPPRFSPEGFGLVDEGIQSGMFIRSECLKEAGHLDNRLFIDCVDTEFSFRVRELGWSIGVCPKTHIIHSIGHTVPLGSLTRTLFRKSSEFQFEQHSPFRNYYIARNNIDLYFRYIFKRPGWVLRTVLIQTKNNALSMACGPKRFSHALAMATGFFHGVLRRRGRIPIWLDRSLA